MPATPSCCDRFTHFLFFSIILTLDAITLECRTTAVASFNLQAKASNSTSSCQLNIFLSCHDLSLGGHFQHRQRHFLRVPWCHSRFTVLHLCLGKRLLCFHRRLTHDVPQGDCLANDGDTKRLPQFLPQLLDLHRLSLTHNSKSVKLYGTVMISSSFHGRGSS